MPKPLSSHDPRSLAPFYFLHSDHSGLLSEDFVLEKGGIIAKAPASTHKTSDALGMIRQRLGFKSMFKFQRKVDVD